MIVIYIGYCKHIVKFYRFERIYKILWSSNNASQISVANFYAIVHKCPRVLLLLKSLRLQNVTNVTKCHQNKITKLQKLQNV